MLGRRKLILPLLAIEHNLRTNLILVVNTALEIHALLGVGPRVQS